TTQPGFAASTSPGKNTVFSSVDTTTDTLSGGTGAPPILTGTILKGKKGHVLAVEATLQGAVVGGAPPQFINLWVIVNGQALHPLADPFGAFSIYYDQCSAGACV